MLFRSQELIQGRTLPIVTKNTPLPLRVVKQFEVTNKDKPLDINLYIGDAILAKECTPIGSIQLERTTDDTHATLIIVIDSNGVFKLKVSSGGVEKEIEVTNILGTSVNNTSTLTPFARLANRWESQIKAKGIEITPDLRKELATYSSNGSPDSKAFIQNILSDVETTVTKAHTAIFK